MFILFLLLVLLLIEDKNFIPRIIQIREDGSKTERIIIGERYKNHQVRWALDETCYLENLTPDTIFAFRAFFRKCNSKAAKNVGPDVLLETAIPSNQVVLLSKNPAGPVERIPNIRLDYSSDKPNKPLYYVVYLLKKRSY